jgi:bis(5'-nucleosyl)-tetraphosphatase (symmetrical)
MSTYAIGDVQGCYNELQHLLKKIHYQPSHDTLWFTGDIINRGPRSLDTLRFIKNLPSNTVVTLGNHDIHLLAVAFTPRKMKSEDTIEEILHAADAAELLDWLRQCPLLHYDKKLNFAMAHAGIYPLWQLPQALAYAAEAEASLRSKNYKETLTHIFGNQPQQWHNSLQGWDRLRFIVNSFTRMRYCREDGRLDLSVKGPLGSQPAHYRPWFAMPNRKTQQDNIVFGHWASLAGQASTPQVYAIDTGCVWGGKLTALRLEDQGLFAV